MRIFPIILLLAIAPIVQGSIGAEKPLLVLISNSIDLELNQELLDFLKGSFKVVHASPADFPPYKGNQRIIILGGPDARDVGSIVDEVLAPPWKEELRKRTDEKNIYVESNKWGGDQLVVVVAGHDRYDTQLAARGEKERIKALLDFKNVFGKITPDAVKIKIESGTSFTLLDVRPSYEFNSAHIKNAINIPLIELSTRYNELDTNKEIVAYCQNGKVSAVAAQLLKNLGFEKVYNMIGGIDAWREKFGGQGIVEAVKPVIELGPGVFNLKDGGEMDIDGVRISYAFSPGGCNAAQEYMLEFVNIENGKPVGKPYLLYYALQGQAPPEDITDDVHTKGFLLGYRIKVLQWSYVATIKIEK